MFLLPGAVKTYGGLIACRFFLGAMEGSVLHVNSNQVILSTR